MMGWLIALGIAGLLAVVPVGIFIRYNSDGILLQGVVGVVRIVIYPRKKNSKHKKTNPPQKEKRHSEKATVQSEEKPEKKGGSITDFLPLVRTGLDFLSAFRKKLRINNLNLKIILGGDDPCDVAVNYGKAWAAVGNLMPQLERFFVIKKRNLEVECDFCDSQTRIFAHADLTITLGRLIMLTVYYGIRVLRDYLKIMNKRKGGALNESKSS